MTKEKKKFQTGNVLSIASTHMLHDIYSSFLAPLRPLLIEKFQMTMLLSSLLDVFQRLPNLMNPFVGLLADKAPARYFIIVTPAITAITMSLLGIAPYYSVLAILLFVMGISGALFHVPAPVMIKKVSGKRLGKGMSFYMLGGEIARTLGPLIITAAVSLWSLEGTWRLIPFGLVASFILYFRLRKIKISEDIKKRHTDGGAKKAFKKLIPFFITLFGVVFFRAIAKSALTGFLPTYFVVEESKSLWYGSIALAILQIAGAAGTYLAGTISDKIGRTTTLMISAIAVPIIMWIFVLVETSYTLPVLFLLGFFIFAQGPVVLALVQDIKTERPAFINGIYMTFNFISGSITVLLAGWLGDMFSLESTYKITATASILAIPFIIKLSKTKSKSLS
ncbi:MAG: MFS transporter [Bacteroidota bacterium]|nr:MFS transporter [Bacteroidota bacterium]